MVEGITNYRAKSPLEQRGLLQSVNGRIAVGWLIVEDLAMVLVLVLLPPLAGWRVVARVNLRQKEATSACWKRS